MTPPIPTNLITGFLGVGKTTAVIDLLKRKNPAEKWAVLVNEYGTVSIDEAFIEGEATEGVSVRSVAGGCFCCTTAPMLPVALHFLLQDIRPDRLLIETSGLGHPARLMDTIRQNYAGRLELHATVGLVTPNDFTAPGMIDSNPVFRDQVQMSDILILNKADTATPELIQDFQTWAESLYPPKLLIVATQNGRMEADWLNLNRNDERRIDPATDSARGSDDNELPSARGWTFDPTTVFNEDQLLAVLGQTGSILRLKGVFHCEHDWIAVNRTASGLTVRSTAYRRDSRLEVFASGPPEVWPTWEAELLACIQPVRSVPG
jgi:G3E family GTPase